MCSRYSTVKLNDFRGGSKKMLSKDFFPPGIVPLHQIAAVLRAMRRQKQSAARIQQFFPAFNQLVGIQGKRRKCGVAEHSEHAIAHKGNFIIHDKAYGTGRMTGGVQDVCIESNVVQVEPFFYNKVCLAWII